eukprot:evm.model.scf_1831.2 EVM.evm.TU.scf_1831.2   scf_1831:20080-20238(-)
MLQIIKSHARPTVIYVSSKSEAPFVEAAHQSIDADGTEMEIRLEKSSLFNIEQ